ncbi:MAG: Uma2 family endonuclease [Acidobacteria bacterium]|nr:Uma2 family endonuclease [Acidobacteriota bacterium]
MTPSPAKKHQRINRKIIWQLSELLKDCSKCEVFMPIDWQITEDTTVQPDALVVCGENLDGKKLENIPVIIFEILSESNAKKDRILKYHLYEAAGVKYYCIIDPEACSADVFLLQPDKYRPVDEFKNGRIRFDLGPIEIEFDFNWIFT